MKVTVKWLKSPRQRCGIPRAAGSISVIDASLADEILKKYPGILDILEREKPNPRKVIANKVEREK